MKTLFGKVILTFMLMLPISAIATTQIHIESNKNSLEVSQNISKNTLFTLKCLPNTYTQGGVKVYFNSDNYKYNDIKYNNSYIKVDKVSLKDVTNFNYTLIGTSSVSTIIDSYKKPYLSYNTPINNFVYSLTSASKSKPTVIQVGREAYSYNTTNYDIKVFIEECRYVSKDNRIARQYNSKLNTVTTFQDMNSYQSKVIQLEKLNILPLYNESKSFTEVISTLSTEDTKRSTWFKTDYALEWENVGKTTSGYIYKIKDAYSDTINLVIINTDIVLDTSSSPLKGIYIYTSSVDNVIYKGKGYDKVPVLYFDNKLQ